jgi:hypothetical protein
MTPFDTSSCDSCELSDSTSSTTINKNNDDIREAIYGLHLTMHDMLKEQHNTNLQLIKSIATMNKLHKQDQQIKNVDFIKGMSYINKI